ncbi:hypothetical protein RhiirA5_419684 [Rhizophagus irregularis]|uniref:Uncharacterized protein n=1 Tax=Rhizophagus irregularis TaxID=588596 RepID=A0A2N0PHN6_9GLOM|nr:hypothetical protein RhiirA5_419684 [Rhizophagus irregularis]
MQSTSIQDFQQQQGIVANFIYKQNYENVYDYKKKDVSTWDENVETVEDEESPPPYDNSTETKSSLTISSSPSQQDYPTTQSENKPLFTTSTSLSQQDYPTTQTETKPSFEISTSPSQQDYPTTHYKKCLYILFYVDYYTEALLAAVCRSPSPITFIHCFLNH